MSTKKILGPGRLHSDRIDAASKLIRKAGGPAVLARKLSDSMGVNVSPARVAKWALIGVPAAWGPILEVVVPGTTRQMLNPWLYTDYQQDIHNSGIGLLVSVSTG